MFTEETVFVLGAGSSCELGLPDGKKLAKSIASDNDFSFKYGRALTNGNYNLSNFCDSRAKEIGGNHFNKKTTSAWLLKEGLPFAASIDNFMATHMDNSELIELGKASIVNRILKAEQNSKLFIDGGNYQNRWKEREVSETWLTGFFHKLVEGVKRDQIEDIFDNIYIINFNYDRCLEHFLAHSLARYFNRTLSDTLEIVRKLWMVRPYGKIAEYNIPNTRGVQFGQEVSNGVLEQCFDNIKTFSEDKPDLELIEKIRAKLTLAEKIVFLGLAFHDANVEYFSLGDINTPSDAKNYDNAPQIYATASGQSKEDASAIASQLYSRLIRFKSTGPNIIKTNIHVREDLKCSALLSAYRKSI